MFWPESATTLKFYARNEGSGEAVQMCLSEPSLLAMVISSKFLRTAPMLRLYVPNFVG